MDIKTTSIRGSHHWKRHALRALTAYNTLMSMAAAAVIVEFSLHWK